MTTPTPLPADPHERAAALISRFGPHPVTALGLDLESGLEVSIDRWLIAACLLGARLDEASAKTAFRALEAAQIAEPTTLAKHQRVEVEAVLHRAGVRKPERAAQLLCRVGQSLVRRFNGSVSTLGHGADDLEELGGRLASLAPGFGRAGIVRFLRPLRELWPAALDLPLEPAARSAAIHLGWIGEGDDELVDAERLRSIVRAGAPALCPYDLEAALGRLGHLCCVRENAARCPLAASCPLRRRGRQRG
ncbi:MAG: hypothetical protein V3T33_10480 [Myxococcota bacterium]